MILVTVTDVAEAGPVVTNLFVSGDLTGNAWSAAFLNDLQTTGAGESAFGYSLPSGANQTDTLATSI